jgi:hypothetical protein
MTYEMKCDCGKTVTVEAANRDEAIQKVKESIRVSRCRPLSRRTP